MANVLAPFGFEPVGVLDGTVPTYAQDPYQLIANTDTTAIYAGDPVTRLSTGYITRATPGTTQIHGIFIGCQYPSVSQLQTAYRKYWPGTGDSSGDVTAFVINHPQSEFLVQANGLVTKAMVGNNANFAYTASGNVYSGFSGATLDVSTVATTATLPFRIVRLYTGVPGAVVGNGSDQTSSYNWVWVSFNNQDFKSLTGI